MNNTWFDAIVKAEDNIRRLKHALVGNIEFPVAFLVLTGAVPKVHCYWAQRAKLLQAVGTTGWFRHNGNHSYMEKLFCGVIFILEMVPQDMGEEAIEVKPEELA